MAAVLREVRRDQGNRKTVLSAQEGAPEPRHRRRRLNLSRGVQSCLHTRQLHTPVSRTSPSERPLNWDMVEIPLSERKSPLASCLRLGSVVSTEFYSLI